MHDGLSYTDKEYDYAFKRGLKVIAFVLENPELIGLGKSDADPELRARLHPFREKVAANRLVKSWTKAEDLPGLVALNPSELTSVANVDAINRIRLV